MNLEGLSDYSHSSFEDELEDNVSLESQSMILKESLVYLI